MAPHMGSEDRPDPASHGEREWFWRLYAAAWVLGLLALSGVFS